jgi:hypothetical protein
MISYRPSDTSYPYFFSLEEKIQRINDRKSFFIKETPSQQRLEIIRRYNIRFILIEDNHLRNIKKTIEQNPKRFLIKTFGQYDLIEVRP